MLRRLRDLSIGKRIQLIVMSVSLVALASIGIAACGGIIDFAEYSRGVVFNLGMYASESSEQALKTQSEEYLSSLSEALSEASDNVLKKVSEQTKGISIGMESIYRNRGNFKGSVPPLPDMTYKGDKGNGLSASGKSYAVDPLNSSEGETLVYDPGEYPSEFKNNVYRTSIDKWTSLTEEERNNLKNTRNVVSDRLLPSDIRDELKLMSNIFYTVKPMYSYNDAMSSAYVGTEKGIVYRYNISSSPNRYDPREREWYKKAVQEKKSGSDNAVWVDTYIDKDTKNLCVTCSKAFCDSTGNILGVSAVDMYLSDINKYALNSKINNNGYVFVVNRKGKIIIHPDYSADRSDFTYNEDDTSFMHNPLNDSIDETYRNLIENMRSGVSGVSKVNIDGKEYYVAYSAMKETGWSMGIATEINEIIASSLQTKEVINDTTGKVTGFIGENLAGLWIKLGIIFLICISIVIIMSKILSNQIVKPILKLKFYAQKIGKGDLAAVIPVNSSDEIGQLSSAFNKMAEDLETYVEDLAVTTADKERIHSELNVAKKIQFSMLPCIFPAFPDRKDFDIYAVMDPAKEVGGDFYDFFFIDDTHLAFVIADVSGKGISAALFMVIAKILIKNETQGGCSPAEVFENVNDQLCENNEADMFVTAFMGILDINTGEFIFSNAGHNPPLIYRKSENSFSWIKPDRGFVLGAIKGLKFKNQKIFIYPEDIVFTYTDGVTEAMDKKGNLFSDKRLISILNGMNIGESALKDIVVNIRGEIDKFANGAERVDDITMLTFRDLTIGKP